MAYKDDPQIEESDNCTVVLRSGHKLGGHMRKWERFYCPPASTPKAEADAGPVMVWCLVTTRPNGKPFHMTFTRNGNYRMAGTSRYDITDFQIGRPPT